MTSVYLTCGVLLAALWMFRWADTVQGLRRIRDISTPGWEKTPLDLPPVTVIVPARNEEKDIAACLESLIALDYPKLEVVAVNDRSTDSTGSIMDRLATSTARLRVLHIHELPPGWMGKTHAMWRAAQQATGDVLLFTDADVFFRQDSLRRAVTYLLESRADHLVLFPTMLLKTAGEKMMIGFFHAALGFAHRPWRVSDPKALDHIGIGAFNLVRRSAYEAVGTYGAMRMEVIDDLRLGKLIKEHGFRQDVALGPHLVTIHWASGALGIVRALSKNSFALLRFNWLLVIGACLGLAFVTLGPVIGLIVASGWSKAGYGLALLAMAGLYVIVKRITGVPWEYWALHPVAAILSIYALLRSAWLTSLHGVTWRGTSYPLQQFRKEAAQAGKNGS